MIILILVRKPILIAILPQEPIMNQIVEVDQ